MGKVDHLTLPAGPATLHRRIRHHFLIMVLVGSILNEDVLPPPVFSYLGILFIYNCHIYSVGTGIMMYCYKEQAAHTTQEGAGVLSVYNNYYSNPLRNPSVCLFLFRMVSNEDSSSSLLLVRITTIHTYYWWGTDKLSKLFFIFGMVEHKNESSQYA